MKKRIVLMAWVSTLVACSSNEQPEGTVTAKQDKPPEQVAKPVVASTKAMALTKAEAAADLSFEFLGKPVPGAATAIKLKLVGLQDLTAVELKLSANEVKLTDGATLTLPALAVGAVQQHTFNVLAAKPGLYVVDVVLQGKLADEVKTWNYAIPLPVVDPAETSGSASAAAVKP